jgi:hypothetical protein
VSETTKTVLVAAAITTIVAFTVWLLAPRKRPAQPPSHPQSSLRVLFAEETGPLRQCLRTALPSPAPLRTCVRTSLPPPLKDPVP